MKSISHQKVIGVLNVATAEDLEVWLYFEEENPYTPTPPNVYIHNTKEGVKIIIIVIFVWIIESLFMVTTQLSFFFFFFLSWQHNIVCWLMHWSCTTITKVKRLSFCVHIVTFSMSQQFGTTQSWRQILMSFSTTVLHMNQIELSFYKTQSDTHGIYIIILIFFITSFKLK